MTEAEWALVTLLDGEKKHDLYSQGFPEHTVDRIWNAYQSAINNPTDTISTTDTEDSLHCKQEES